MPAQKIERQAFPGENPRLRKGSRFSRQIRLSGAPMAAGDDSGHRFRRLTETEEVLF